MQRNSIFKAVPGLLPGLILLAGCAASNQVLSPSEPGESPKDVNIYGYSRTDPLKVCIDSRFSESSEFVLQTIRYRDVLAEGVRKFCEAAGYELVKAGADDCQVAIVLKNKPHDWNTVDYYVWGNQVEYSWSRVGAGSGNGSHFFIQLKDNVNGGVKDASFVIVDWAKMSDGREVTRDGDVSTIGFSNLLSYLFMNYVAFFPNRSGGAGGDRELEKGLPKGNPNSDAVAVVIGVGKYLDGNIPQAKYALSDAGTVSLYLESVFGVPKDNVLFMKNPTRSQMVAVLGFGDDRGSLADRIVKGKSDVIVYFSGHGYPDQKANGEPNLLPSDADPRYLNLTGYPVRGLVRALGRLGARSVTIVLEACYSGNFAEGSLSAVNSIVMEPRPVPRVDLSAADVPGAGSVRIVSASEGTQVASWHSPKGHSLFTYYLLLGLKGEADANGDGAISFNELSEYVSYNVSRLARREYNVDQIPVFSGDPASIVVRYR